MPQVQVPRESYNEIAQQLQLCQAQAKYVAAQQKIDELRKENATLFDTNAQLQQRLNACSAKFTGMP